MAKFYTPTQLSENIKKTPEGFLLCLNVPIARTGEMIYGEDETPLETDEEGQVLIYRDSDEVFNIDTIASFEGKAITIRHPEEFVSPSNWSYLAKGIIQNVRKSPEKDEDGEESLLADLLITDALAIKLIENGLREVSCGYEAEYEQTGEGKGRQSKIIGNHLALVQQGRAGQSYAINDHKGKTTMSKLADQMKKIFGKVIDEAMVEEKKEDKKAKDEDMMKKEDKKGSDTQSYDELVKMVKDLGEKISAMTKAKDEGEEPVKLVAKDEDGEESDQSTDEDDKDKEKAKDEDESPEMEERLKALEAAVEKLLEAKSSKEAASDESEDEDMPVKKTGDAASRRTGLEKTKDAGVYHLGENKAETMTAEKLNEINAAHWARK